MTKIIEKFTQQQEQINNDFWNSMVLFKQKEGQ